MDAIVLEALRHSAWANGELLRFLRDLPAGHLDATGAGSFGSVLETFRHLVNSDAGYARSLSAGDVTVPPGAGLEELEASCALLASMWERRIAGEVEAEQTLLLDRGAYETAASVVWAQALHHGTLHREQICAVLTARGLQPPDLQVWAYADATGRSRWVRPPQDGAAT